MESSDRLLYRKRCSTSIGSSCTMEQKILVLMAVVIANACVAGTIPATPENITVTFLTPTTVRVSWQTMIDLNAHPIEKYIVTYKPTDDRVVQDVAGNSEAIILDRLSPSTQYSIAVTAIWLGKKYRSRQIIFRTLDMPKTSSQQDYAPGHTAGALGSQNSVGNVNAGIAGGGAPGAAGGSGVGVAGTGLIGGNLASAAAAANGNGTYGDDVTSTVTNTMAQRPRELPTIRGVEIGIVLIVLMVWAGAIALFFNRWGKIRMLLPYQPDYKHEQLKVPGTGVCTGAGCNGQHSHQNLHPDIFVKSKSKAGGGISSGGGGEHKLRQKRFTQQRSILKNSTERSSNQDEQELLEAKKQLILRRRRLFSHYRQYEQWRRRQFSYDPCYYRAIPLPIGQASTTNYAGGYGSQGQGAFRRRRQYRRQYSCAEREDSRESRESSSLHRYKGASVMASESFNTDSANYINYEQQQQEQSHQRSQQPLQQLQQREESIEPYSTMGRRSHFHMLHEERSASISERCTRSRINSAIFVSSEGRGFDSIEFLRRHGSQSVLCRKARSAENITDNERKKSFSDNKGSWRNEGHNDSDPNASNRRQDDMDGSAIELRECRPNANNCSAGCCAESRTLSVLTTNTSCDHPSTSAAAAASMAATNVVVGSISIETPPSHIKDELHNSTASIAATTTAIVALQNGEKRQRPNNFAGMSSKTSVSRDSNDTVEELVLVPTVAATAVPLPEIAITNRSRTLVRQRSSTVSISPHRSPKTLALKHAKPKIAALPMVSVSGPSPPHEKPPPQPQTEYL
ncbi:uncharacterized protein LOC105222846 isoform X2 [Bactrocera dorsalis]|uniref:Uncharacterized protein LOC105222846 isoform X2 n=1 Tax=Bactrocera dorsalis TaxID=27457 RepID=A0A8N4L0S3_BACDO|nr:uncharacterized protein LOC105222846 isoform X2 [Bactrocera dorsalis]